MAECLPSMQKGPRFNSQYWKGRKRGREEWREGGQAKDHRVKGQERRGKEAPPQLGGSRAGQGQRLVRRVQTAKEAVSVIGLTLRPHHLQKPGRGAAHSPACLPHLPFPRPGAAVPKYHFVCWASMRDPKPTQQKYEGSRSPPCLFS